jgi:hypothetical protein
MNGTLYSHDPYNGSRAVNDQRYRNNHSSIVQPDLPNTYYRYSYSQPIHENIHLQQRKQSNTVNQRHLYMNNLQQRQRANLDVYNFENGGLVSSTSYYDRIHAQFRSNTSHNQPQNPSFPSQASRQSRDIPSITTNRQSQQSSSIIPVNKPIRTSIQPQVYKPDNKFLHFL